MLKPSPSRNQQRTKSLKVKHVLQICLLMVMCIWFLYQVKQSYCNSKSKSQEKRVAEKGEEELPMLKLGRKDLKPELVDEQVDLEDEESKEKDTADEETEEGEKEKAEEGEHQQLPDLIDEDDKDV